jgi:hypothetical protein
VIDPNQEIFFKRLYRTKCVKASVPSNHNQNFKELLQSRPSDQDEKDESYERLETNPIERKVVYLKDLRMMKNIDLSKVIIVDNQLLSFAL